MESAGVVVDDLAAATAFFLELGLVSPTSTIHTRKDRRHGRRR